MAGTMIPLNVLTQQSLFVLLHQIDLDLAEQTKNSRCPIVEDRFIMPITSVSPVAVLLIFKKLLNFVTACAAAVKAVVAGSCRHSPGEKSGHYTGKAKRNLWGLAVHRQSLERLFS